MSIFLCLPEELSFLRNSDEFRYIRIHLDKTAAGMECIFKANRRQLCIPKYIHAKKRAYAGGRHNDR